MQSNTILHRLPVSPGWPAALLVAGVWLALASGGGPLGLLSFAVFASMALLLRVWQSRARAARRLQLAADVYAGREIARAARGPALLKAETRRKAVA